MGKVIKKIHNFLIFLRIGFIERTVKSGVIKDSEDIREIIEFLKEQIID